MTHASIEFYRLQSIATFAWWILIRVVTKQSLEVITRGSVVTRPSWMPLKVLMKLQRHRTFIFRLSLLALFVGGWGISCSFLDPGNIILRIAVAISISVYHLVESSVTCRHGEYPLMYNALAMCLPTQYARAASWGIAVHFVTSTGLAKLWIGGAAAWMSHTTMHYYLTAYAKSKRSLSRPLLSNTWACRRKWVLQSMAVLTLFLECILIPSTLWMPPSWRYQVGTGAMIVMHLGIFVFMSKKVGLVFCTTLPTYLMGFSCQAEVGSQPWLLAVGIALVPSLSSLLFRRKLLPENWPLSAVSLFMWSGDQAKRIGTCLMTENTRVVLATADVTNNIVGLSVLHHGAVANPTQKTSTAVHDSVLRVIGFTLLYSELLEGPFLPALRLFLTRQQRLFELSSGKPLTQAWMVEIDNQGCVVKILNDDCIVW